MCKKQSSVSHSSTESEIVSLDAGLRLDGLLAFDLWGIVIEVLRSTNDTARQGSLAQGDLCGTGDHSINKNKTKTPTEKRKRNIMSLSMFSCNNLSDFLSDDQVRKQSAMSKRGEKATSNEGPPMAKARPCLVGRDPRSEEMKD